MTSSVSLPPQNVSGHELDNLHLAQDFLGSIPTAELPSTSEASSKTDDPALYVEFPCIRGPQVPYAGNRYKRPGWFDPRTVKVQDPRNNGRLLLICFKCFNHWNVAPNFHLTLRELPIVVASFEALTPEEQASVPVTAYLRAKTEFPKRVSPAELAALRHTGSSQVIPSPAQAVAATAAASSSVAVPQ